MVPRPPVRARSSLRSTRLPESTIQPAMCTPCAASAAFSASSRICRADLRSSPDDEVPPQPATRITAASSAIGRRLPIGPRDGSIAFVEARGIHHVGVAVADLDEAVRTYERLFGGRLEHRARVEEQGVEAATLRVGDGRIELLAALGADTPVGRFLAKRGPGMHHVAYEVADVAVAAADLAAEGAELIDREPRRGLFGLEVAFVHPESVHGVLSEVVSGG